MSKAHREDHWTVFDAHTLLKHGVVDRYVRAWIQILKQYYPSLWIVDGFAGKGRDDVGNPGSPLLFARSAAELRDAGAGEVNLIAIEPRDDWFAALSENLAEFDAEHGGQPPVALLRHGTLAEHAGEAFERIGAAPAFVFLDPFGAEGLSHNIVERVLALPKGEVLALFSHLAIGRHLGLLAKDHTAAARRDADGPRLFPDLPEWTIVALERAAAADAQLLPNKEAAWRILTDLFGTSDEVERILRLPPHLWADEVLGAYLELLRRAGARNPTVAAVLDDEGHAAYYLIHAARDPMATIKIKEAIHSAIAQCQLPERVKATIRVAHAAPLTEVVRWVLERFAGETVRWVDKWDLSCVKTAALADTQVMWNQLDDLKKALKPYRLPGQTIQFAFPARES
jgi:three-Cys-motif partner protein